MIPEQRRHLHLAALACAAMPGLDPVAVAEVYDAEHGHVAVQVIDARDRRWLVELPLSAAESAAEDLVGSLLPLLATRLPFLVPRPEASVVLKGEGRVTVGPWIEDARIAFDDMPAGPGLAVAVGQTLAAIHNLDPALYEEAGVPTYDAEAYRQRRLSELDRAAATGHVPQRLLTRWEEALELIPLWRFAATPVHGSFDGDAVRVRLKGEDATVTAVTTWAATRVADPADDFAALYDEAHPDTFDSVMEAYTTARSERPDRGLETRARLASELDSIHALLRAHSSGDKVVVEEVAGQLRRLDAETADHPLIRKRAPQAPSAGSAPTAAAAPEPAAPQAQTPASEPVPQSTGAVASPGREETPRPVEDAGATSGIEQAPVDHLPEANEVDGSDIVDPGVETPGVDPVSPATVVLRPEELSNPTWATPVTPPAEDTAAEQTAPPSGGREPGGEPINPVNPPLTVSPQQSDDFPDEEHVPGLRRTEPEGSRPAQAAGSRPGSTVTFGEQPPAPHEDTIVIPQEYRR